jgi:hypothetical protein
MKMRIEVLKPTNDDWCGSHIVQDWPSSTGPGTVEQMFVSVVFNGMVGDGTWRTCVWGTDDCGMEYDCDNQLECWNKFVQVIGMDYVDMEELTNIGFVGA